jgi:hypothetical protein
LDEFGVERKDFVLLCLADALIENEQADRAERLHRYANGHQSRRHFVYRWRVFWLLKDNAKANGDAAYAGDRQQDAVGQNGSAAPAHMALMYISMAAILAWLFAVRAATSRLIAALVDWWRGRR